MIDYNQIEEQMLKKESASRQKKKKMKISGKSVFRLQEIIKRKACKRETAKEAKPQKQN